MLFPKAIYVEQCTIEQQMRHIASEYLEVMKEFLNNPSISYENVGIELWDVIHSCETALRILEEQHGVNVNALRQYVYEKNRSRKYYKEG